MTEIIHLIKGYLGYDVRIVDDYHKNIKLDDSICYNFLTIINFIKNGKVKLKLRPLENLTKKQTMELYGLLPLTSNAKHVVIRYIQQYQDNLSKKVLEYLHKNHIDYQDLIGKGYAIKKEKGNE